MLQALDAAGAPIFTMMNLAAHNQEIGHGPHGFEISSDWPGYFADEVERLTGGGVGLFLVGDNGSEEDPSTVPLVGSGTGCDQDGEYPQAQATGETFARDVVAELPNATAVPFGAVGGERSVFCVPIENNLFKAASTARLFGERKAYSGDCSVAGPAGSDVRTEVNVLDVGPELQFIGNPGEAFPALMVGSPWGIEDVGCPGRPNPPVPTWHARAESRFQVGLANDLIGYEIPAWAFSSAPGFFTNTPPNLDSCVNDADDHDPAGHQHKLETEGVGPTASNMVASELTRLLDGRPDAEVQAVIRPGRFLAADGSTSRRAGGAVGIWLADPGSSVLAPGTGTIVALPGVGFFGSRAVNSNGAFADYDGATQTGPGITTRGMRAGAVSYYVDPYPALSVLSPGAARPPAPGDGGGGGGGGTCDDATAPTSSVGKVTVVRRRGRVVALLVRGSSTDTACGANVAVTSVRVAVARLGAKACRYLRTGGTLTPARRCARPVQLPAKGTAVWRLKVRVRRGALPPGLYRVRVLAVDAAGRTESRRPQNKRRFRLHGERRSPRRR